MQLDDPFRLSQVKSSWAQLDLTTSMLPPCIQPACDLRATVRARPSLRLPCHRYAEIVHRSTGRYDLKADGLIHSLVADAPWQPVLKRLLGTRPT